MHNKGMMHNWRLWSLLALPLLWVGGVYGLSLLVLLVQSFFAIDDFSGVVKYELTLKTYYEFFSYNHLEIVWRTMAMAMLVTITCFFIGFPIAWYTARYTSGYKRMICYILIMVPLWSSYLVRVYAWKMILAKEGIMSYIFGILGLKPLLEWVLDTDIIGGPSLSFSMIGTYIVLVYLWLPFMIIPMEAGFRKIPNQLIDAARDLGANRQQIFKHVIVPNGLPAVVAGSIFTFSLSMGDYITPQIIGNSKYFIGNAVYTFQGLAGNIPLAAAFSMAAIVIMMIYLFFAKKMGAFHAL